MAMVDVRDDSSLHAGELAAEYWLVGGLAAIWRSVCIHEMNRVNPRLIVVTITTTVLVVFLSLT